jgi:hypothetical protein
MPHEALDGLTVFLGRPVGQKRVNDSEVHSVCIPEFAGMHMLASDILPLRQTHTFLHRFVVTLHNVADLAAKDYLARTTIHRRHMTCRRASSMKSSKN